MRHAFGISANITSFKSMPNWCLSSTDYNILHHVGLLSDSSIMRSFAKSSGILLNVDPRMKSVFDRTPTDSFYSPGRDLLHGVDKESFEVAERAWWDLMAATCEQNGIDFETFEPEWRHRLHAIEEIASDEDDEESLEDDSDGETRPANACTGEHADVVDGEGSGDADDSDEEEFTAALEFQ